MKGKDISENGVFHVELKKDSEVFSIITVTKSKED